MRAVGQGCKSLISDQLHREIMHMNSLTRLNFLIGLGQFHVFDRT